jgi:hypothetical protein
MIYPKLMQVYCPDKFSEFEERLKNSFIYVRQGRKFLIFMARIPAVIIYTSYLFWGLKLDLKDLQIRKFLFFGILIFEYSVGIVCIAYIANYIISK